MPFPMTLALALTLTSLIITILAGLSGWYAIHGRFSDRQTRADWRASTQWMILAAAVTMLAAIWVAFVMQ